MLQTLSSSISNSYKLDYLISVNHLRDRVLVQIQRAWYLGLEKSVSMAGFEDVMESSETAFGEK